MKKHFLNKSRHELDGKSLDSVALTTSIRNWLKDSSLQTSRKLTRHEKLTAIRSPELVHASTFFSTKYLSAGYAFPLFFSAAIS
jgi:hypothetical protein